MGELAEFVHARSPNPANPRPHRMRNIPTDLLHAFVTVIDLKGYTRAGERLGRSQPAVSLQMKRLHDMLGLPLFEKEASGTQLTEAGEMVASYARRMLALNDELLLRLTARTAHGRLRIGIPSDYADMLMPRLMEGFAREHAEVSLDVVCDVSHELLRGLRQGLFDIVIAMTADGPAEGAFLTWRETLSWVGAPDAPAADETFRLVCYPEGCVYRRNMLSALQREGRGFEIVYTSPSLSGIEAAVSSGFGATVLADRLVPARLRRLAGSDRLPSLADVHVGIYLRADGRTGVAETLAARFADVFSDAAQAATAAEVA
jgi:DNA-binding transcriptional LysR family regulator